MEPSTLMHRYQIEPYRGSFEKLQQIAVAFSGSPRPHRDGPERILLIGDPFSQQGFAYEFRTEDVLYAEELPRAVMPDGSTAGMARLWVRRGATALKLVPFVVEATAHRLAERA